MIFRKVLYVKYIYIYIQLIIIEISTWGASNSSCQWRQIHIGNTLRPWQIHRHFADEIFNYILLTKNVCVLIKISLNFIMLYCRYSNYQWSGVGLEDGLAANRRGQAIIWTNDGKFKWRIYEKFWRGCAATIPLATENEGRQNCTLGYGKWLKIIPLAIGNVTKITTLCMKFCHLLRKKIVELGQNGQIFVKIYPWLRSLSQN